MGTKDIRNMSNNELQAYINKRRLKLERDNKEWEDNLLKTRNKLLKIILFIGFLGVLLISIYNI